MKLSQASEASVMAAAMKSQLSQLSELTKENKRLRDENEYNRRMQESTLVLREQVLGLEQKLEREEAKNVELTKERIKFEVSDRLIAYYWKCKLCLNITNHYHMH